MEQLIKFCYLLVENEIFLVYSFSKQFAAKEGLTRSNLINMATGFLHIIKIDVKAVDKNLPKNTRCITEEVALAAIFYLEEFFIFCNLINKNVLEWSLLISKEHTLNRSSNPRNHPTLCF